MALTRFQQVYYESGGEVLIPSKKIRFLKKALKKGRMTKDLKYAVRETIHALDKHEYDKAAEITVVKSYISGGYEKGKCTMKHYHFCEDDEYNEKVLGTTMYQYLDGLQFELSVAADTMPAGMMGLTANGIVERKPKKVASRTVRLIRQEHKAIKKEAARHDREWKREEAEKERRRLAEEDNARRYRQ